MKNIERIDRREPAVRTRRKNPTRVLRACVGALVGLAFFGCDTSVTNPGPIQDDFLDDPTAQGALVNGMQRALAEAINFINEPSAAIAREVHPSGSTGTFGITIKQQRGELVFDDQSGGPWTRAYRARFLANDGIRRIEALDPADQDQAALAEAYLWKGYTHRLLGEAYCESVIDQQQGSSTLFLDIAIQAFDMAQQLGTGDIATAAIAGRASVKVDAGDWSGAVADAALVPTSFQFEMPYWDLGDDDQGNRMHVSTKNEPYKAHSQWNTWVADYGLSEDNPDGDPRMPFMVTDENGDAAIDCCGPVPWWPQQKMDNNDSPVDLSTGEEMRLIEAENHLRSGSLGPAVILINGLRTAAGMDAIAPATLEEGWTFLKRERAIELWLEARRLPDLRRWNDNGTPGDLQPLEQVSGTTASGSHLSTRDFCWPIAKTEIDTNPNISR